MKCRRWPCLIATAFTAAHGFICPAEKMESRRISAPKYKSKVQSPRSKQAVQCPMSNVQCPPHKTGLTKTVVPLWAKPVAINRHWTLDIGHWTNNTIFDKRKRSRCHSSFG